jgi:hypothetical protein
MDLPEDDTDAVETFISFLYRGHVAKVSDVGKACISMTGEERRQSRTDCMLLSKPYRFGEKYCMNDFMDQIIDRLQEPMARCCCVFPATDILAIYQGTHSGSALRRLIVAQIVHRVVKEEASKIWVEKLFELCKLCLDFTRDYFIAQNK